MPSSHLHRRLSRFGAVVVFLIAAGCGDTDAAGQTDSAPATSPAATSAGPEVRVVEVVVAGNRVETATDQVEVASGDPVRLVVTSDVDDEVHVHGVDLTAPLVAGEPTSLEFTVPEPGVFEVETHDGGLLLVQLLVR
jgi:plastocyanin